MYKGLSAWSLKNYEVSVNNYNLYNFIFSVLKCFKVPALIKNK